MASRVAEQPALEPEVSELRRVGLDAGLLALGVTSAEPLEPARSVLPLRQQAGLAGSMQFTYRNPARSTDPTRILAGARSLVVGLSEHQRTIPEHPGGRQGRVARYAIADAYQELRVALGAVAEVLSGAGFQARVVADSNALVDRNAAWRAGLGWWGKSTNLLTASRGSYVVIGAVVTDAELPSDGPVDDGCGSCTACLDGCPTGALVAPGVLDARRCIAWLVQSAEPIPVELRAAVGDRLYGCDICQEVCPPNRAADRRAAGDGAAVAGGDTAGWVDVEDLLRASDEAILARHGRWYIAGRDPDVIRRTALVVLGNSGEPGPAAELLVRYLADPNPLLRAHAVWAARRLGLDHLARQAVDDPDPAVRAELDYDIEVPGSEPERHQGSP